MVGCKRDTGDRSEDGSILVLGMLMLVLLSLIGIAVINTSTIEVHVSANERFYKENLYDAEAATLEAAQRLENADLKNNPPAWLRPFGSVNEANDMFSEDFWANSAAPAGSSPNSRQVAAFLGYGPGSSLDVSVSRVHLYAVYGRSQRNNGTALVRVNYRKAF